MVPKLLFPFLHNCEAPGSSGTHKNAANPVHSSHVYHELNADFIVLCTRNEYTTNKDHPQEWELAERTQEEDLAQGILDIWVCPILEEWVVGQAVTGHIH